MRDSELLYFNGIRPDGTYVTPPMEAETFGRLALDAPRRWKLPPEPDPRDVEDPKRMPRYGVDPKKIADAGWGLVVPMGTSSRVRSSLKSLLDLRREQAGPAHADRVKILEYLPGQDAESFLRSHRAPPGPANPDRVPYYLLLVGGPEAIPFQVQYELDQQYAVGRLHFDQPIQYQRYAHSVERAFRRPARPRRVAFFGVENEGDSTTERMQRGLTAPLADRMAATQELWHVRRIFGEDARRSRLLDLMGGASAPSVLFAAGHGLEMPCADSQQRALQGGLLCADWPGLDSDVEKEHVLTAADIPDDADLAGQIVFLFACYSAGTPRLDSFPMTSGESEPARIAPEAFTSALCRRLLGHPGDPALAVVGHVDRAWTTSFDWLEAAKTKRGTGQPEVFASMLQALLDGLPVGAAMEYFGQLQGDLATKLSGRSTMSARRFGRMWLAHNDAQSFVVFGDPAVTVAAQGVA